MADISMCFGIDCPLKTSCYRYLAKSDGEDQTYMGGVPYDVSTNTCAFYWDIKLNDEQ